MQGNDLSYQQIQYNFVKSFQDSTWLPCLILERSGPASYTITFTVGRVVRHHVDHIHSRTVADPPPMETDDVQFPEQETSPDPSSMETDDVQFPEQETSSPDQPPNLAPSSSEEPQTLTDEPQPPPSRSRYPS